MDIEQKNQNWWKKAILKPVPAGKTRSHRWGWSAESEKMLENGKVEDQTAGEQTENKETGEAISFGEGPRH